MCVCLYKSMDAHARSSSFRLYFCKGADLHIFESMISCLGDQRMGRVAADCCSMVVVLLHSALPPGSRQISNGEVRYVEGREVSLSR